MTYSNGWEDNKGINDIQDLRIWAKAHLGVVVFSLEWAKATFQLMAEISYLHRQAPLSGRTHDALIPINSRLF